MAHGTRKRIVRLWLIRNADVIEYRIEIELRVLFYGIDRGRYSRLDHVHPCERVGIDGAVCQIVIDMRTPCGGLYEIPVERDILPCECPFFHPIAPCEEGANQFDLGLLFRIRNLFPHEAVYLERLIHDMRPVPDAALVVKL